MLAQKPRHRDVGAGGGGAELLAVTLFRVLVLEEAVQVGGVRRIDPDLERLQPVALDMALEGENVRVGRDEAVEARKGGRRARAQIGPDNAAALDHRMAALPDAGPEDAVFGLCRRVEACAGHVEQPPVKSAAKPAILEPAERQIGAAMRAMPIEQTQPTRLVAKQHERLAEEPHRAQRPRPREFLGKRHWLPIAAHQHAGRCARPGHGHALVLIPRGHGFHARPAQSLSQAGLSTLPAAILAVSWRPRAMTHAMKRIMSGGVSRPTGKTLGGLASGLAHASSAMAVSPGRDPW